VGKKRKGRRDIPPTIRPGHADPPCVRGRRKKEEGSGGFQPNWGGKKEEGGAFSHLCRLRGKAGALTTFLVYRGEDQKGKGGEKKGTGVQGRTVARGKGKSFLPWCRGKGEIRAAASFEEKKRRRGTGHGICEEKGKRKRTNTIPLMKSRSRLHGPLLRRKKSGRPCQRKKKVGRTKEREKLLSFCGPSEEKSGSDVSYGEGRGEGKASMYFTPIRPKRGGRSFSVTQKGGTSSLHAAEGGKRTRRTLCREIRKGRGNSPTVYSSRSLESQYYPLKKNPGKEKGKRGGESGPPPGGKGK